MADFSDGLHPLCQLFCADNFVSGPDMYKDGLRPFGQLFCAENFVFPLGRAVYFASMFA